MLKGLSSFVVRALLLCLVATPAWAGSTLYIGGAYGGGQTLTYTDSQGAFSINGKATGVVSVSFQNSSDIWNSWYLEFQAPTGSTLAPGNYDNVDRIPFQGPLQPGADFVIGDSGCDNVTGRFVVQAISTDSNGNVTSFAADFQLSCDGGQLVGAIRYNSTLPYPLDAPTVDAGANQIVMQGTDVALDGSLSEPGNGSITAYTWTQLSGPSVSLADPSAASTVFTAPDVPVGGEDVVLQLEVDNSLGLSSTSTVTVHVSNPADPQTLLSFTDTHGLTTTVTPLQAPFTATPITTGNGIKIYLNGGTFESWTLDFAPPSGQTLQVGTSYDMAQNYPSQLAAYPGLSVSGSTGCSGMGRFVVLDLQTDGSGNITSFAADFDIDCNSFFGAGESVSGKIRYNSTAPLTTPWADAGEFTQLAAQGMTVTLPSAGSDAGGGNETITSYQWTQLSGPTVTLSDATAANPTFSAPTVSAGGADLVFQLTITNSDGLTGTDTVTVHVANPADAATAMEIDSDPTDSAGQGQDVFLYSPPYTFQRYGIGNDIYTGAGVEFSVNNWTLEFVMPAGQNLQTGTYSSSQAYPWQASSSPALSVYQGLNQCVDARGQFTILDVQTDGSGNVTAFAADFWQTCDGKSELRGKIRYNSSSSIFDPLADAGQYQSVASGDTVALSAAASDAGGNGVTIASYQWTQLSGPGVTLSDATAEAPTFTAPSAPLGGSDLVFQVMVTNSLGLTGTATVRVHVANPSDPAPFTALDMVSDAGDPVGQGQTIALDSTQATFSAVPDTTNGIQIAVGTTYGFSSWNISIAPPVGQLLQTGVTYELAQAYYDRGPYLPGLEVDAPGAGCGELTGRFTVLDIRYDKYGNIVSLAADFDQYCVGNTAGLHGMLRYNSGVAYSAPFADAGPTQSVTQGSTVTLSGASSFAGSGETMVSYQWTQLSGTSVTLSDASAAAPTFTAPSVPTGGADLVFQLTVTNALGMSASDTVTVHVTNPADPVTVLYVQSDPGDQIGQGLTQTITPLLAQFSTSTLQSTTPIGDSVVLNGGGNYSWTLDFLPPQGQVLQAGGNYDRLQSYPGEPSNMAGMSVAALYNSCYQVTGRFEVLDIQTDGTGKVTSLAIDFDQYCDGNTAGLHGMIRYNSTVPLTQPVADPGAEQLVTQGNTVTLDGSQSEAGGGATITSYQWTQISGPTVTLSDPTGATTGFTAPDVPSGGDTLVFQLTVTNSLGETTTEDVTVKVANPSDPTNGFYIQTRNGTGAVGIHELYGPLDGTFTTSVDTYQGALSVQFDGGEEADFSMDFRAPGGQPLQTGSYTGLVSIEPLSASAPSFYFYDGMVGCDTVYAGQFNVLQIAYDGSGNVTQFAADFAVYCAGQTYALHGKIRYNSTVTILSPTVDTGPSVLYSYAGLPVQLDGSASTPGAGSITSYHWTQVKNAGDPTVTLAGANTATPTFTAPPVPAGGRTLTFALTVTNTAGLSGSATAQVDVGNESDPKTLFYFRSDPDDPAGKGASGLVTSVEAGFNNNFIGTDHIYVSMEDIDNAFSGYESQVFYGVAGKKIVPGTYVVTPNALAYRDPTLSAEAPGGYCGSREGVFIVHEATFSPDGALATAAVDFTQHCLGSVGVMRGMLRYNSTTPVTFDQPVAYAGANQQVTSPGAVNLDGYGSYLGMDGNYSYQWQQVSGPRVTLSNSGTAFATFGVNERMLEGAGTNFVFRLTVTSSLGGSSTSEVTVHAALPTANMLSLRSYAGDPVGNGKTTLLKPADSAIQAKVLGRDGLGIQLLDGSGWTLDFAAPAGQKLQAGTYSNAVLYNSVAKRMPSLFVGTKPGQCKAVRGSFTVRDVVYARNGTPDVLAVDFMQYCNSSSAPLYGEIRYHSTLP